MTIVEHEGQVGLLQLEKAQILFAGCWHATQTPFTPGRYWPPDISWRPDTSRAEEEQRGKSAMRCESKLPEL